MTGIGDIGVASAFASLGILAGALHLTLLSWNVRALVGRLHNFMAVAASLGRAGATLATFALATRYGALALIATLGGFLVARAFLVNRSDILVS